MQKYQKYIIYYPNHRNILLSALRMLPKPNQSRRFDIQLQSMHWRIISDPINSTELTFPRIPIRYANIFHPNPVSMGTWPESPFTSHPEFFAENPSTINNLLPLRKLIPLR